MAGYNTRAGADPIPGGIRLAPVPHRMLQHTSLSVPAAIFVGFCCFPNTTVALPAEAVACCPRSGAPFMLRPNNHQVTIAAQTALRLPYERRGKFARKLALQLTREHIQQRKIEDAIKIVLLDMGVIPKVYAMQYAKKFLQKNFVSGGASEK